MRPPLSMILLLGFWIPPLILGRWVGGAQLGASLTTLSRLVVLPVLLIVWVVSWFFALMYLAGPYERLGPGDPGDAPAMFAMSLLTLGGLVVLPVSALACRHGYQSRRRQVQSSAEQQSSVAA